MAEATPRIQTVQLHAQDYAEVVAALKALNDNKGSERRTTARMDVQAKIEIYPYANGKVGQPFSCLTRDVSFRGIGLFQSKPAPRGTQFVVVLPKQIGKPLPMLCTVMYSRPLADSLYNVGASFVATYSFDKPPESVASPATAAADAELNRIRQSILG
jgi:hypothetical protein